MPKQGGKTTVLPASGMTLTAGTASPSASTSMIKKTHNVKTSARNVPAFLNKLYFMVNDPATNELIRWNSNGDSFFVPSPDRFGREVLPRYFKHSNFGSFVRQLNMYGFKKVPHLQQGVLKQEEIASELLEFSNANFVQAEPDSLSLIRRQKSKSDPVATSSEAALHLPTLLSDLATIRQQQTALSSDLKDLQTSNRALWEEAIQSRERHTRHQETINKILRFLATVFSGHVAGSEAGASPRTLPEEVVDEPVRREENKGKGKVTPGVGTSSSTQNMMSRLLLEDVKGRREARAREAEEDAAYELDDMEEISSASQYVMPSLSRNNSIQNYNFTSNEASSSDSSRFTTIPSNSGTPGSFLDTTPMFSPSAAEAIPSDLLSSLLSPTTSNNFAAFLNSPQNTASASTGLNSATNSTQVMSPLARQQQNDAYAQFGLDPSLAALLPTLNDDYSQSIQDHNMMIQEVGQEKKDLDERTSHLEQAIARLMDGLPVETRAALSNGTDPNTLALAGNFGDSSDPWDKNVMGEDELDTFLAQYVNTNGSDASTSPYTFTNGLDIPSPSLPIPLLPPLPPIGTIDEYVSPSIGTEATSPTSTERSELAEDDADWNVTTPAKGLGGRKRKSDAVEPSSGGSGGARKSMRKRKV